MSGDLASRQCEPCRGGVPALERNRVEALLDELDGWQVLEQHHLSKTFVFDDFSGGLGFVNEVGALADRQGHHPDVLLSWGRVRVDIWTHKIDGLTESDFVLAAKIDRL